MVLVGLPADSVRRLPIFETVMHGISVVGSVVGTASTWPRPSSCTPTTAPQVVREVRQLDQVLDQVNEAFEQVEQGQVEARLVFELR
jgi:propanol-preferring alcohol dehydrogenase